MEKLKVTLPGENNFAIQEAYKFLRTNIQFCGANIKVIMLTSCYENEGKSTVSLSLAKSFAELGKKVLLIDADMRKSVFAGRNLNIKKYQGLSELLSGMVDIQACLNQTEVEGLFVLLAGKYPPNPVELLGGEEFGKVLSSCRKVFDYIIIDSPPLGVVSDAAVIAPKCDGTILVVGKSKINYGMAMGVVEQLRNSQTPLLGAIRNHVHHTGSNGKEYSYSYS